MSTFICSDCGEEFDENDAYLDDDEPVCPLCHFDPEPRTYQARINILMANEFSREEIALALHRMSGDEQSVMGLMEKQVADQMERLIDPDQIRMLEVELEPA